MLIEENNFVLVVRICYMYIVELKIQLTPLFFSSQDGIDNQTII